MGHSRPLFIFVSSIQLKVNVPYKWLDSNHEPLELEATTLPTEPQPQQLILFVCIDKAKSCSLISDGTFLRQSSYY